MKPHSKATCMHINPIFVQPKRPLLTKIRRVPYQHPVPFIEFPKTKNNMMLYPVKI